MLLNMGFEYDEEPVFELDGDTKFDLGTTSGNFWPVPRQMFRRGDELGDVSQIPPTYEAVSHEGMIEGDMQYSPTLVTQAEFEKVFAEQNGNLRATAKILRLNHQTAVNYANEWGLPVGPPGKRSTLTALLPKIAADREAGMDLDALGKKYRFLPNTIKQALWRHGY
jgi:hypothetical protein